MSLVRLLVSAGKATPSPPVGPALGSKGIKSMDFCKRFNDETAVYQVGLPIPTTITVAPDKTFTFTTRAPPTQWLIKTAAGVVKGSGRPGASVVGKLSLKHVYEIAKIKQRDPGMQHLTLHAIAKSVVAAAGSMGIDVVP